MEPDGREYASGCELQTRHKDIDRLAIGGAGNSIRIPSIAWIHSSRELIHGVLPMTAQLISGYRTHREQAVAREQRGGSAFRYFPRRSLRGTVAQYSKSRARNSSLIATRLIPRAGTSWCPRFEKQFYERRRTSMGINARRFSDKHVDRPICKSSTLPAGRDSDGSTLQEERQILPDVNCTPPTGA